MPLTRVPDSYQERDGVTFLMQDENGDTVPCRVSPSTLQEFAARVQFAGTGKPLFETYREFIEDIASDAFEAGGPLDHEGRILVTSEAIARVMRSA